MSRTGSSRAGGARHDTNEEADERATAGAGNNQPKSGSKDVQNITLNIIF
jgi:hypothetical protein